MTPQFMGQGMSSGVRDAHNLAWKLDAVLRGGADPKLIDTYESERKPHAKEMIDISVSMKNFVSLAKPIQAKLRNVVVKTLLKCRRSAIICARRGSSRRLPIRWAPISAFPDAAAMGRKGVRCRSLRSAPTTDAARCSTTFSARASPSSAAPPTRAPASTRKPSPDSKRSARGSSRSIPTAAVAQGDEVPRDGSQSALVEVEDLTGEGIAWFRSAGATKGSVAIVRPDKFVYALAPAANAAAAVAQALAALGERRVGAAPAERKVAPEFA